MASWVIFGSWTQCGQPHRIWPSRSSARSCGQRLGQQDDVAVGDELVAGQQPGDVRRQLLVGHAEALAVAAFEVDARPQVGVDPLEVPRMDRQPALVLLAGPRDDSEAELVHTCAGHRCRRRVIRLHAASPAAAAPAIAPAIALGFRRAHAAARPVRRRVALPAVPVTFRECSRTAAPASVARSLARVALSLVAGCASGTVAGPPSMVLGGSVVAGLLLVPGSGRWVLIARCPSWVCCPSRVRTCAVGVAGGSSSVGSIS